MTVDSTKEKSEKIGSYFSDISKHFSTQYDEKGLKKHTKFIFDYFDHLDLTEFTLLELGCGVGGLLFKFLDMDAKHIYGIDLSEQMIRKAKENANKFNYEQQSSFVIGEFNVDAKKLLSINQADIVIADRVLCCYPVPMDIMEQILRYNPKYIVIVQPRKNILVRKLLDLTITLKQIKWRVKRPKLDIPFVPVKTYTEFLAASKFTQVLQRFRYFWEVIIYQLQEDN